MRNQIGGILFMAALGSATANASTVRTGTLPNGFPYTQLQFTNGLQVYVVENHAAPILTFQTWFNVGSAQEKSDPRIKATGLAHLFEHMMFRGTPSYPDGKFDQVLTQLGGTEENATTWYDRTNYYESVPSDQLPKVLELESDRLQNLQIAQHFETERKAVLGELHMYEDDPNSVAFDKLYATAFTTHPYQYTVIGSETEISNFQVQDAQYFYDTYYAPNNATLLIVGDVLPANVEPLVEKYYGAIAQKSIPHFPIPAEPAQTQPKPTFEFKHPQLTQKKLVVGYHVPGVTHADFPALWVAQALISVGQSSLVQTLWVESGKASSASGDINHFRDPGLLVLAADLEDPNRTSDLLGPLDAQLASQSFSTQDIQRAKNLILLSVYESWEDNSSLGAFMGEYLASAGDPLFAFSLVDAVNNTTPQDVARVIAKYLVPSNRTEVLGSPLTELSSDE